MEASYIAIDLKSFYASVECIQRGLNPLTTHLVVADARRTEKTICLAVTPSLKSYGIPGRARLFEVVEKVREVNALRRTKAPGGEFSGSSWDENALKTHPELSLDYIVAPPQMSLYMQTSARIYQVYLKYVAPEDIHVYSIDEVFLDVTHYLKTYGLTPRELAMKMVLDVLRTTGITATAGIGPNLYLCKVAMDIRAKHIPPDENGVRIAELTEQSYRQTLWNHRPLTDFWRVGPGYQRKLQKVGLYTMGDIARCSLGKRGEFHCEDLLYKLFGVSAELLIDHAWGFESCTIRDIKAYRPSENSLSSGQVLQEPYPWEKARLVTREMADALSMDLVGKRLVTDQIVLTIGYDIENRDYQGPTVLDHYGRRVPKSAHGSRNLGRHTASTRNITQAAMELFDQITDKRLLIRRLTIGASHVLREELAPKDLDQLNFFAEKQTDDGRERKMQEAVLTIQRKYGKNAILKGMNFQDGATTRQRNGQIGGHKA